MYSALHALTPRIIDHDGCSLAYWVHGSGPALFFIQGVGVSGSGWFPQIDTLSDQYTCIWFDNRGMGRSQPTPTHLTLAQLASDANAVLHATGHASAHVIGHSLGGLVALQLALNNPAIVRSLVLMCTFSGGKYVAPLTLRMMWLGMRTQLGTKRMRRNGFLKLVMPPGPIADCDRMSEEVGKLFGHDLATQPPVVQHQMKAMRAADVTDQLNKLNKIPSLVISAIHDPIAPPSAGQILANNLPNSRYIEVADASHGLPISQPQQTNGLLIDWFESVSTEA